MKEFLRFLKIFSFRKTFARINFRKKLTFFSIEKYPRGFSGVYIYRNYFFRRFKFSKGVGDFNENEPKQNQQCRKFIQTKDDKSNRKKPPQTPINKGDQSIFAGGGSYAFFHLRDD